MKNQAGLLGGLVFVLLLVSMAALRGEPAVLALPVLIYLAAAVFHAPRKPVLKVERTLSSSHSAHNQPITVRIRIENPGEGLEEVMLLDELGGLQTKERASKRLLSLPEGGQDEWEYTLHLPRGLVSFSKITVLASDHSGLFSQQFQLEAPGRLLFYPEPRRLRRIPLRPRQTRGFAGSIPARVGGSGVDFFGVRDYQPGDPPRRINWRLTAHQENELYTNEFEQDRNADVGLILDARLPGYPGPTGQVQGNALFESAVQAAADLAKALIEDGNRLSLLIYGASLTRVFPGYGKVQLIRMLQSMASAKPGFNYALESLNSLPTRMFPTGSQLVIVSPLMPDDFPFYRRLRSQGYTVLLVSPDPLSAEAAFLKPTVERDLAIRFARIQRKLLLHSLSNIEVLVIDWDTSRPLDHTIQRTIRRKRYAHQMKALR